MNDRSSYRSALYLSLLLTSAFGAPYASAQTSAGDTCRVIAGGLVLAMETMLEQNQVKDVALQMAGLTPQGPRFRIAEQAYRLLKAGTTRDAAVQRAVAQCLQMGADAVADDEPNFQARRTDGGGSQLCSDVASGIAGFLIGEPGANRLDVDAALTRYRSSDPREIATPRLRRAMELALQRARIDPQEAAIAQATFDYCERLDQAGREQLDREFYVP